MAPERIEAFDLARIALGGLPAVFLVEVVLRLVVLYVMLVAAFRFMGRRMSSQMTRNELMALVSLAAAVGPALQDPQQGLLPPIVVAVLVTLIQRALAWLTFHSHRFENLAEGEVSKLVVDGRMNVRALRRCQVSRERLFAELRRSGVTHLGSVERVFFEPDGTFSLLRARKPAPGLSLVPEWDAELAREEPKARDVVACGECGNVVSAGDGAKACSACGVCDFRPAASA